MIHHIIECKVMYIEKTSDKYFYPEENEEIWNINSKWKYKINSCCLPELANEMERIIEFSKKWAGHQRLADKARSGAKDTQQAWDPLLKAFSSPDSVITRNRSFRRPNKGDNIPIKWFINGSQNIQGPGCQLTLHASFNLSLNVIFIKCS